VKPIFSLALSTIILSSLPMPSVFAQTSINAPTTSHPVPMTPSEQSNVNLALDWWRIVIDAGHLEAVPKYQADTYIQHNPNISTGRTAFLVAFSQGNKPTNPIPSKLESPPVLAGGRGDFVWFLWEKMCPQTNTNPQSYYANGFELLRVSNQQIQEHWDTDHKDPGVGIIEFGVTPKAPSEFNTGVLSTDETKALEVAVRAGKDVYLKHNTSLISALFADDYQEHDPNIAKLPGSSHRAALESFINEARRQSD
jgi:predicted SnoaL-like aldol condensation-catalyzing enzyme